MSITEFDKELYDRCRRREGYNEGVAYSLEQKTIEAATNALALNLSPEQVSQIAGLPLEEVLELQKNIIVDT